MNKTLVIGLSLVAVGVAVAILTACSKKEVGFDTLEQARQQAKDNAVWNAQRFRATDPRFDGLDIIARGDSTQMPDCPQGDGWASIDYISKDKRQLFGVKCSTVSSALGCSTGDDFKKKTYATEEGHCAPVNKVPFPLPKLVQ